MFFICTNFHATVECKKLTFCTHTCKTTGKDCELLESFPRVKLRLSHEYLSYLQAIVKYMDMLDQHATSNLIMMV